MTELGSSRLGFGCASLPGRLSRREAAALIETALDAGISHFDTAPLYHWGRNESVLGAVARRRRDDMVIVTKAGLAPANRFAHFASRALAGAPLPYSSPRAGRFAPRQVRRSVEQSLRALGVERLDALLLHEIALEHVTDGLKSELSALRQDGKVGAIGVATSLGATSDLIRTHPDLCGVVQVDHHWLRQPLRALPKGTLLIVHSVLRRRFGPVGSEGAPHSALQEAMARNINGVTLFSSSRRDHIAQNALLQATSNDVGPTPVEDERNSIVSHA